MPTITLHSFRAYIPLLPWFILAIILGVAWAGVHLLVMAPAEAHLSRVEASRSAMREKLTARQDARETAKDMSHLFGLLPSQREFAQLPVTISEEALQTGVALPSVSYAFEKTDDATATKAVFRGAVTGSYRDLRQFIYGLETASRLVFIDDLDVSRPGKAARDHRDSEVVTFNLKMSTYVRRNVSLGGSAAVPGAVSRANQLNDKAPKTE